MKNLPENVFKLEDLVAYKENRVISRNLAVSESYSVIILSFDKTESVSYEEYPEDTLYTVLDGSIEIVFEEKENVKLKKGESFFVKKGILHAIESDGRCKILQMMF